MTITTKENTQGKISGYYVDGQRVRKNEIDGMIYEAARNGEIVYVDYYTGQEFKSLTRSCYPNMKVVFTGDTYGKLLMTESAAGNLGYRVIKRFTSSYHALRYVSEVEEMTDEEKLDAAYIKLENFVYTWTRSTRHTCGLTVAQAEQVFIAKTLGATDKEVFAMIDEFANANATEPNLDDYAVTPDAQQAATDAELEAANSRETKTIETPSRTPAAIEAQIELYKALFPTVSDTTPILEKIFELQAEYREVTDELRREDLSDTRDARLRDTRRQIRNQINTLKLDEALDDYVITPDAQQIAIDAEEQIAEQSHAVEEEPLPQPVSIEIKTADDFVRITNDFWTFAYSYKYDAAINQSWVGVLTYTVDGKDVDEQQFFNLMAQRGACQFDTPAFEPGKEYLLHARNIIGQPLTRRFKVLKRGKMFLTVADYNERRKEFLSSERYKIYRGSDGEFINVPNEDLLTYDLYAKDVADKPPITGQPPDPKTIWERVRDTKAHGIKHVLTANGRHMWFHFGALISKTEAEIFLKQDGFTIDEFLKAEKIADDFWEQIELPRLIALDKPPISNTLCKNTLLKEVVV